MRLLATLALVLASACSATDVDNPLAEITVEGQFNLPIAAARAGAVTSSWTDEQQNQYGVIVTPTAVVVSMAEDIQFLTTVQSVSARDQLGGHGSAVDSIDLDVKRISIFDVSSGTELDPSVMGTSILLGGVAIGPSGYHGRVALGALARARIVDAVEHGRPVVMQFAVLASCTPERVAELPPMVDVKVIAQPIVVVQALRAL